MAGLGKFDFRELEELARSVELALSGDFIDRFIRDYMLEMAYRIHRNTVMRTPTDTTLLKRSWVVGEVKKVGNVYQIEISNNVHYASFVEMGHRKRNGKGWVMGKFMVTISTKQVAREMPGYLERRFTTLLTNMMNGRA